ncbi:MAG: sugar kinase [Planctomycetes bacterium]|nr:sugar kinase [Planctomycetota bacterium]
MSLLVVGSVGLDTVETPHGKVEEVLGGAATYFSCAAALFGPVRLVGVVGTDFPSEHRDFLARRGVDLSGLVVAPGKTFRWSGRYEPDMNERRTLSIELNVFGEVEPQIPREFFSGENASPFLFLANGSPRLHLRVLDRVERPGFVVADTMDHWLESDREGVLAVLSRIDGIVLNDAEARVLAGEHNLIRAARWILRQGPSVAIVKKGEHGSLLVTEGEIVPMPSYPVENVVDPTGAGDSFAGGLMGYLAANGSPGPESLRRALVYGTVIASFNIEAFSLDRLREIERRDVEERVERFRRLLSF